MKSKLYLISADRETMKEFVYGELIHHTASSQFSNQTEMRDGTDGLYIHINENYENAFIRACDAYGVTIRWNEKAAA